MDEPFAALDAFPSERTGAPFARLRRERFADFLLPHAQASEELRAGAGI